jgi:hypothetical protein
MKMMLRISCGMMVYCWTVRGGKDDNGADVDCVPAIGGTAPGRRHETRAAQRDLPQQRIVELKIRVSSAFIVELPRCTT